MKKINPLLFVISLFIGINVFAQDITQTVRGRVADLETKSPLIGANIAVIEDSSVITGATTDENGYYRIENVPVHTVDTWRDEDCPVVAESIR